MSEVDISTPDEHSTNVRYMMEGGEQWGLIPENQRSARRRSPHPIPRALAAALRFLDAVAPRLARYVAKRLFMTPPRSRSSRYEDLLACAGAFRAQADESAIACWSWGRGPVVLLVHGWGGTGSQLGAFVDPLVRAGFRVVAFDAPAHGRSEGARSSPVHMSRAIAAVASIVGPIDAIIAHSVGAIAAGLALERGLDARRLVLVAPLADPAEYFDRFLALLGLPPHRRPAAFADIERRLGVAWSELPLARPGRRATPPLLVVHDGDDAEIGWQNGAAIARSWPDAQLVTTRGLGHRRILRDPGVVGRVVEFLGGAEPARCANCGGEHTGHDDGDLCASCWLDCELYDREARRWTAVA